MPCDPSLAKHRLCRGNTCPETQDCCVTNTAFSCQPVCDDACGGCCCPHEAYATISGGTGITGPYVISTFANAGIAGLTGGTGIGSIGEYTVFYEPFFFDGCTGASIPTVTVSGFGGATFASVFDATAVDAVILTTDLTGAVDSGFTIRAIQTNRDC